MRGRKYDTVVWDWNGTLFNDMHICIRVENEILRQRGLPLIDSMERYHSVFCFPVKKFYENLGLDFTKESFEELSDLYVAEYEALCLSCGLHDGAEEVLALLKQSGYRQALISAASRTSLAVQMKQFDIHHFFTEILGIGDNMAGSKAGLAREWMDRNAVDPKRTVFIGDTVHDFEVASAAGADCILVANGHYSRENLLKTGTCVLDSITQLPDIIGA